MEASGYTVKHGRGGKISFFVPGQERATRLRASTLGDGYDPEDIKAVIAGARPIPEQPASVSAAPRRVNLIVDIQERLRSGKGAAYARWAKVYNLKQMAATLQFMQEQNITEYDQLSAKAEDAVSCCLSALFSIKSVMLHLLALLVRQCGRRFWPFRLEFNQKDIDRLECEL